MNKKSRITQLAVQMRDAVDIGERDAAEAIAQEIEMLQAKSDQYNWRLTPIAWANCIISGGWLCGRHFHSYSDTPEGAAARAREIFAGVGFDLDNVERNQ